MPSFLHQPQLEAPGREDLGTVEHRAAGAVVALVAPEDRVLAAVAAGGRFVGRQDCIAEHDEPAVQRAESRALGTPGRGEIARRHGQDLVDRTVLRRRDGGRAQHALVDPLVRVVPDMGLARDRGALAGAVEEFALAAPEAFLEQKRMLDHGLLYFAPMQPRHFRHWPPDMPRSLRAPRITLQQMFLDSAAKHPDKVAAVFGGKALSYSSLRTKVENLAGHLQSSCGVKRGDRVLLDMQNGHDFVVATFAILRADAVVVPVSPMNLTEELRHYIADSDARVALTEEDLAARFSGLPLEHVLIPKEIRTTAKAKPSVAAPDDLCMMPYTSGSTGQPKGCMHTHATVLH